MSGPVIFKASSGRVYDGGITVRSILTYPLKDYAGDYVKPDGGDWSAYSLPAKPGDMLQRGPLVNWTHETPIGRGEVAHKALKHDGQAVTVAVGNTRFFERAADLKGIDLSKREVGTYKIIGHYTERECLETAAQAERLVRDDVATGVSVEFKALSYRDLPEHSLLENRPCRHVETYRGIAYAHALQPVNDGARTLIPGDVTEKAARILSLGKIAGQAITPVILKALRPLVPASTRTTVRIENKAMEELSDTPPQMDSVAQDEETTALDAGAEGPTPAVRTLLDGAQMLLDLGDQLTQGIGQSEHAKARKYVAKIISELQATAEEMNGMAEKVRAELEGDKADADEEAGDEEMVDDTDEDGDAGGDYDMDAKALPIERRKDGSIICKSFPNWKPRRFTVAALSDAPAAHADADPITLRALQREINKTKREAKALLQAAVANAKV